MLSASKAHLCLSDKAQREATSTSWEEGVEDPDTEFPSLLNQLFNSAEGEDDEDRVNLLLGDENSMDDEDAMQLHRQGSAAFSCPPQSRPA